MIENLLPSRKTSLFVCLLIVTLSSVFLWFGKIGSAEWVGLNGYALSAYCVKRYKSEKNANGAHP